MSNREIENDGRGPLLRMGSDCLFYPLDPRPEEFTWNDVASGLAAHGRYQGQLPAVPRGVVYTVAQHAVLALRLLKILYPLAPAHLRRAVFHHDDVEGIWGFGDICGPVKRLPQIREVLKPLERRVEAVIAQRILVPSDFAEWEPVKRFDHLMAAWEDRDLRGLSPAPEAPLPPERITCWSPQEAFVTWIEEHEKLQEQVIATQQRCVEELSRRFDSYAGGDRPPSPPVRLMRDLSEAEATLRLLRLP